jgi:hypothetical protein
LSYLETYDLTAALDYYGSDRACIDFFNKANNRGAEGALSAGDTFLEISNGESAALERQLASGGSTRDAAGGLRRATERRTARKNSVVDHLFEDDARAPKIARQVNLSTKRGEDQVKFGAMKVVVRDTPENAFAHADNQLKQQRHKLLNKLGFCKVLTHSYLIESSGNLSNEA